jgi:hypothetical protein
MVIINKPEQIPRLGSLINMPMARLCRAGLCAASLLALVGCLLGLPGGYVRAESSLLANLCPQEYRLTTLPEHAPGYQWDPYPTIFNSWLQVRMQNNGPGQANNVAATITCTDSRINVIDGVVSLGNIPAGSSVWSTDDFEISVNMDDPPPQNEGIEWRVEYDDANGGHHVINNVPMFAPEIAVTYTWESYRDEEHTTVWGTPQNPYSGSYRTAFLSGDGFVPANLYSIGYYDGLGAKVQSDNVSAGADGKLNSWCTLNSDSNAEPGTWHAVVFDAVSGSPPPTYAECTCASAYVVEDNFEVTPQAIPEFPAAASGLLVAGICLGAYCYFKRGKQENGVVPA